MTMPSTKATLRDLQTLRQAQQLPLKNIAVRLSLSNSVCVGGACPKSYNHSKVCSQRTTDVRRLRPRKCGCSISNSHTLVSNTAQRCLAIANLVRETPEEASMIGVSRVAVPPDANRKSASKVPVKKRPLL